LPFVGNSAIPYNIRRARTERYHVRRHEHCIYSTQINIIFGLSLKLGYLLLLADDTHLMTSPCNFPIFRPKHARARASLE